MFNKALKKNLINDRSIKSLPGWTYTSDAFFELEKTELILKIGSWFVIFRIFQIQAIFLHLEIFNERIFVIRGEKRDISAFQNFCSHRGTKLIDEILEPVMAKLHAHIMLGGMILKGI